ncbi:LOW QUALITY PROTEIN: hypothetical protein LguiB_034853 [Lonicera macranthoides]
MIQEEEDGKEDDVFDGNVTRAMQMGGGIDDKDMQEANECTTLNVHDIDAYWLQRKISHAYMIDPQQSQKLAEETLRILAEGDDREVENKLLMYLQFDQFPLIKFLLRNRLKIVWCTRLARAEDQDERKKIEKEMMGLGPDLAMILEQLNATRETAKERQKNLDRSIREEARRLKDEIVRDGDRDQRGLVDRDTDNGWLKGQRRLLDLDSIAFNQTGLLRANNNDKRCIEVHVPALKPKPLAPGEELIKVSAMPDWAQPAFEGMTQLNRFQSRVYNTALFSAENILLCAPTGSGKTNVAMLTILQQIALNRNEDGSFNHSSYKIVYIAPMKALVAEVTTKEHIRLVGLSATLPNYEDVALFLQVGLNKGLFHFDNSYRPCPLAQQYIGVIVKKPLQRFQLMNDVCYEKVIGLAGKHQVLIFVHSRKETAETARSIRDSALANDTLGRFLKEDSVSREILQSYQTGKER